MQIKNSAGKTMWGDVGPVSLLGVTDAHTLNIHCWEPYSASQGGG